MDRQTALILSSLRQAMAYPHVTSKIECIETHISWVFLTGQFAYKVKKPVQLEFLDFSTLALRHHYCEEELRLNRRFAPELYLEVVSINQNDSHYAIQGTGPIAEYAVKMRQFPAHSKLDELIQQNQLTNTIVDQLAEKMAHFHLSLKPIIHSDAQISDATFPAGTPAAIQQALRLNVTELLAEQCLDEEKEQLFRLQDLFLKKLALSDDLIRARYKNGFVRDCHGDMHLGNLAYINGEVILFDCIEFSVCFRYIDVICDLAFPLMDLEQRDQSEQAARLLNMYLEQTGDYQGIALLNLYKCHLALVRAKVCLLQAWQRSRHHQPDPLLYSRFQEYLQVAGQYLSTRHPVMLLMSGLSGSGKSTIAANLAYRMNALRIRSDVERKRLFNLKPLESSRDWRNLNIYTDAATERTLKQLEQIAIWVIEAGYSCIVDATFLQSNSRTTFICLANQLGCPIHILNCLAKPSTLKFRLSHRLQSKQDASEADLEVLQAQITHQEAFSKQEIDHVLSIDTEQPIDYDALIGSLIHAPKNS